MMGGSGDTNRIHVLVFYMPSECFEGTIIMVFWVKVSWDKCYGDMGYLTV